MRSTAEVLRGAVSTALFVLFGLGAVLVSPLMLVLREPTCAQPVVRALWRPLVWLFAATGLIRVDRGNLAPWRGAVLAANHPSLIDVVLLTVLVPRTLYVAKHALRGNPFLSAIVRATALPDDARLADVAAPYLARGWNVLVFPEGTRTPDGAGGTPGPFRRGVAQLVLRTGAPLVAIGISQSRRILGKRQMPWDMGRSRVVYRFRADGPRRVGILPQETRHRAAIRVTADLHCRVQACLAGSVPTSRTGPVPAFVPGVAAVVPVFNPEPGLCPLCAELVRRFPLVVVVDDGSVDATEAFRALPSVVVRLRHDVNRGKGRAIKTALAWLCAARPDIGLAVFADGDGQHRADDVAAVVAHALETNAVTFGVRDFSAKGVPFRSWWGNRWTSVEVWLLHRLSVADTQTGLRAVPARLFPALLTTPGERFEFEARIFGLLRRLDERLEQVPVATVYVRGNRTSHFRPLRDTLLTQAALFA